MPSEPVSPKWDVDLSIPIVNRTWTLRDILTRTPQLSEDPLGVLIYEDTLKPAPVGVGDELKVSASPTKAAAAIPAFSISAPPPLTVGVNVPGLTPGQTLPFVLPFDQTISTGVPPIAEFVDVTFESGDVTLTVKNNLPVVIQFPDPITLKNFDNTDALLVMIAGQIQPNETRSSTASLAGRRWTNALAMDFRLTSPGSATPVAIPDTAIVTTVQMSNAKATSATARIPQQNIISRADTTFQIDDSTRINSVEFSRGTARIVITNYVDVDVGILLQMNQLRNKATGQPLVINGVLPRRGAGIPQPTITGLDFANFEIDAPVATGSASFSLGLTTLSSGGDFRTINKGDSVVARFESTDPLYLKSITGILRPTRVGVDRAVQIDFGDFEDTTRFQADFTFDDVVLDVALTNETGFISDANLTLFGSRAGREDSLTFQTRIVGDGTTDVVFNKSNSRIIEFMNSFVPNLPNEFVLRGSVIINPIDVYQNQIFTGVGSSASIADSVRSSIRLSFPLKIGVSGGSFSEKRRIGEDEPGGPSGVDIDTSVVDLINSGSITFRITNGLPLRLELKTAFSDIVDTPLFDLPKASEPALQVSGGAVDSQGRVTAPALSTIEIKLSKEDIDKFVHEAEFIHMTIEFETAGDGTTPVQFRTSDAVSVRAHANLSTRIDPDAPGLGGKGHSKSQSPAKDS